MHESGISRRRFFLGGLVGAAAMVSACSQSAPAVPTAAPAKAATTAPSQAAAAAPTAAA